jgi:hypothetical protein
MNEPTDIVRAVVMRRANERLPDVSCGIGNKRGILRPDSAASPTAQCDRTLSPLKVSPKREFLRFRLETFGRFSL